MLPGPRIRTAEDARRFVQDVAEDPGRLRPSRYPAYARVGPAAPGRVADRLLDWLDDFQRGRHRRVLFSPVPPTDRDLPAAQPATERSPSP